MTYYPPKLSTLCPECGQLVGVTLDWNHRNGVNEIRDRYRRSRHLVEIGVKRGKVPFCLGSRAVVDKRVIFFPEKASTA